MFEWPFYAGCTVNTCTDDVASDAVRCKAVVQFVAVYSMIILAQICVYGFPFDPSL